LTGSQAAAACIGGKRPETLKRSDWQALQEAQNGAKLNQCFHFAGALTTNRSDRMSASIQNPTQKPSKPFPAWRLRNGVANASGERLESASESAERWGWGGGGLVLLGIIGEFIIAIFNPPFGTFPERWGSPVCDLLIGLGVAGEIMFSRIGHNLEREMTRRSNERAAQAERETRLIRARVADRILTPRESAEIASALSNLEKQVVVIHAAPTAPESELFARHLCSALATAGWDVKIGAGLPNCPFLRPTGVIIQFGVVPGAPDPDVEARRKCATTLAERLIARDIRATEMPAPLAPSDQETHPIPQPYTMRIYVSTR
jgi:hypothetical protein